MIRLRSVGRLPCPDGKVGSHSWVLDVPRSGGSVVIFNSKHACHRDAFTGAALAEGPVPVPPTDSPLFAEGAAAAAPPLDDFDIDAKSAACVVQGATGPLMVVFSPHYCALGVLHLPSGTIRDLLPLRLTSRGPGRSSLSLVTCITGSRHRGTAGIVFIGRAGQPTVQAVRVDPPELVGSTGTSLHSNGCVIAAACHPSKALLALSLNNGIIQLWDFSALCTDAQASAADIGGGGGGAASSVGGGGGGGDMDIASPTSSPKARTAKSVSGDDRVPVRPQLTGRMKLVGKLSTQTIPGCEPPQDGSSSGPVFEHLAFHPSREWVCAAASVGCVGVWNLEGEDLSGGDAGGGGARQRSTIGGDMDDASDFGADQEDYDASYAPADARVHAVRAFAGALMPPSASGQPSVAACAFHPVEALVVVVRGAPAAAGGGSGAPTHEIALLSLLDAGLPCLYSVPLPAQPASVCVDAVSARAFITWSGGGGGEDAAAAAAGGAAGLHTRCDVVALSGGALLGRGHHSIVGAPAAVPPWAFVDAAAAAAVPAPLQCHLLRSMPVLIKAGPGGGADIPAVKAVLYSQALERDVAAKDRAKPRRLITLPGHTDDVMRSARGEGFSRGGRFLSGHLQPYRLVPGPLLDGTRRCFLVLYEVVGPPEDTPPGGALPRTEALAGGSHTVCGLAIQAAKGEQETEANLRPLMAASDACFVGDEGGGGGAGDSALPSVLAVEAGGHRLSVYVLPAMAFVISMEVAIPIARVFPTPTWLGPARGQVLYVVRRPLSSPFTVPADGALQFDEALVYSVPGGLKCPLLAPGTAAPLQLGRHEHVVDVQFQPLAAAADAHAWGCGGAPLVAVLTNKRVIVARAATLAAVAHSASASHAHAPAGTLPPAVQSIAWLGSAVACALDDGQIAYLAPRSDIVGGSSSGGGGSGDGGARLVQLVPKPLLCVDRAVCAGGVAIAAVLPDRVCYLVRGSGGSGIVHMVTRPLMPLEALVSGLLAYAPAAPSGVTVAAAAAAALQQQQPPCRGHARLQALRRRQRQRLSTRATLPPPPPPQQQQAPLPSAVAAALRLVVARHAPPRAQHAGVPAGEGAGLSAGATSEAFRLLAARGLPDLACHVAGVSLSDTFGLRGSADLFFHHRPWVPPGERARAAARAGLPLNAALEAAGDDPALHDYVLDSDAMITAQLPARGSALARAWRAFAAQARAAGRLDTARRLLELAGDDAALALLLSSVALELDENGGDSGNGGSSRGGGDGGNRETALEHLVALRGALKAAGVVADPLVLAAAEAVINKAGGAAPLSAADPLVAALLLRGDPAVGALFRRASLLAGLDPLSDVPPAAGVPPPPKPLVTGDALPLGLPPPTVLKPLALNTLGQWLGRCRPECMEPYGGGGAAAAAAAADESRAAATTTAAVPEPGGGSGGAAAAAAGGGYDDDDRSSWVTVGGQWNAEDNVCGYWRFSEGAAPATAAAAAAGAAIDLQDLSKFKNAAAVRGGAVLEETTSPTDPGDRGKVAPAYDLCFSAEVPTAAAVEGAAAARGRQPPYARGMFVPCRRGCAVDLGAFHDDARRCCFTLEMWVKMGPSSAAEADDDDSDGGSAAAPAAAVAAGGGLGQYGAAYHVLAARYSLRGAQQHLWSLSVEGNGQLVFIPGPRARAELAADTDVTRGAVATPPGAIPAGRWVHVALTLDASREETAAEAVLYVDCARCAEGAVRFARVARGAALAETELAVGADVRGWRVAEVRLWAMLRDAQALQDLREVYLALAEQKKGRIVIRSAAAAAAVMSPIVGIAPPSGGGAGAGGGSEGRKSVVPLSLIKPPVVSPGPSRLSTPTVSSDPRKARLAATVASPPLAGGGAGAALPGGAVTTAESSPMSVQSPGAAAAAPSAASPAAALPPVPALVAPPTGAVADPRKARLQRRPSAAPEAGAAAVRAVEARGSGVPAAAPVAATEAADDGWAAFSGTVPAVAVAMAAATGAAVTASALLHRGSASPPPPPAAAAAADGWAAFGSSSPKPGGAMSAAAGSAPDASPSRAAAADAASWAAFDMPTSPMAAATSPFGGATAGASDAWAAFEAPPSNAAAPEGSAGAAAAAARGAAAAPLAAASAADGDGWAAFGSPSPTPRAFSVPRPPGSSASAAAAAAAAAAASGAQAEWVQFGSPKTPARFREVSAPGDASAGAAAGDSWDAFGAAAAGEEAPAATAAASAAAAESDEGNADAGAAQAAAAALEVAAATSAQSTAAAAEKTVLAAPAAAASVATMPAAVAAAVATVAAAVEERERRPSAGASPDRRPSGIASPDKIRARSGSGDDVARAQRKSSSEMLAQPAGGRPGLAAPRDSRKAALEARRQRQAAVAAAAAAERALEEKNAAVVAAAKYEESLKAKAGSPMALEARQRHKAAVAAAAVAAAALDEKNAAVAKAVEAEAVAAAVSAAAVPGTAGAAAAATAALDRRSSGSNNPGVSPGEPAAAAAPGEPEAAAREAATAMQAATAEAEAASSVSVGALSVSAGVDNGAGTPATIFSPPTAAGASSAAPWGAFGDFGSGGGDVAPTTVAAAGGGASSTGAQPEAAALPVPAARDITPSGWSSFGDLSPIGGDAFSAGLANSGNAQGAGGDADATSGISAAAAASMPLSAASVPPARAGAGWDAFGAFGAGGDGSGSGAAAAVAPPAAPPGGASAAEWAAFGDSSVGGSTKSNGATGTAQLPAADPAAAAVEWPAFGAPPSAALAAFASPPQPPPSAASSGANAALPAAVVDPLAWAPTSPPSFAGVSGGGGSDWDAFGSPTSPAVAAAGFGASAPSSAAAAGGAEAAAAAAWSAQWDDAASDPFKAASPPKGAGAQDAGAKARSSSNGGGGGSVSTATVAGGASGAAAAPLTTAAGAPAAAAAGDQAAESPGALTSAVLGAGAAVAAAAAGAAAVTAGSRSRQSSLSVQVPAAAAAAEAAPAEAEAPPPAGGFARRNSGIMCIGAVTPVLRLTPAVTAAEVAASHAMSTLLSNSARYVCVTHRSSTGGGGSGGAGSGETVASLKVFDLQASSVTRYPINAENAIMRPGAAAERIIALYLKAAGGGPCRFNIFSMDNRGQKLKDQPMAAALLLWRWLDGATLALVTHASVFYWNTHGAAKPVKAFDRRHTLSALSPKSPAQQAAALTVTGGVRPPLLFYCCSAPAALGDDAGQWGLLRAVAHAGSGADAAAAAVTVDLHDLQRQRTYGLRAAGAAFITWPLPCDAAAATAGTAASQALAIVVTTDEGASLRVLDLAAPPRDGYDETAADALGDSVSAEGAPLHQGWSDLFGYELTARGDGSRQFWVLQSPRLPAALVCVHETGTVQVLLFSAAGGVPRVHRMRACEGAVLDACVDDSGDLLVATAAVECAVVKLALIGADAE